MQTEDCAILCLLPDCGGYRVHPEIYCIDCGEMYFVRRYDDVRDPDPDPDPKPMAPADLLCGESMDDVNLDFARDYVQFE